MKFEPKCTNATPSRLLLFNRRFILLLIRCSVASAMATSLLVLFLLLLSNEIRGTFMDEFSFPVAGTERDSWAVLVSSSRYWFNYRHMVNILSFYHILRERGFPDDRIILMNAMNFACDARNLYIGEMKTYDESVSFCDETIEADFEGDEVTAEAFLNLLTGRTGTADLQYSQQLLSGPNSRIFVFLSGHGGNEFFKFQDQEEISAMEIGNAILEMELKGRYKEMIFMVDTCQASTLANHIHSKNVYFIGSSSLEENSYAYTANDELGVSMMDRFSYKIFHFLLPYVKSKNRKSKYSRQFEDITFQHLFDEALSDVRFLMSNIYSKVVPGSNRTFAQMPISDFFDGDLS